MPAYRAVALFVRERYIEELEAAVLAHHRSDGRWEVCDDGKGVMTTDQSADEIQVVYPEGRPTEAQAAHIALQDPAHTVLDLKGKVQIINGYLAMESNRLRHTDPHFAAIYTQMRDVMCTLAEAYHRHPGFNHWWL